jgi:hypothetical protein
MGHKVLTAVVLLLVAAAVYLGLQLLKEPEPELRPGTTTKSKPDPVVVTKRPASRTLDLQKAAEQQLIVEGNFLQVVSPDAELLSASKISDNRAKSLLPKKLIRKNWRLRDRAGKYYDGFVGQKYLIGVKLSKGKGEILTWITGVQTFNVSRDPKYVATVQRLSKGQQGSRLLKRIKSGQTSTIGVFVLHTYGPEKGNRVRPRVIAAEHRFTGKNQKREWHFIIRWSSASLRTYTGVVKAHFEKN